MKKVYVVQEIKQRGGLPVHDISPAGVYGELEILIHQNNIGIAVQPLIADLKSKLRSFDDDDFLLLLGDPIAMGICVAIAAEMNRGKVNCLRWDRHTRQYIKVTVDLRSSKPTNQ